LVLLDLIGDIAGWSYEQGVVRVLLKPLITEALHALANTWARAGAGQSGEALPGLVMFDVGPFDSEWNFDARRM
jgi:hypothetical protein